jgi:hypothetical protein
MTHMTVLELLATLSITAGSISPVFLIFCVNQLTTLAHRSPGGEAETARFAAGKYLTALTVITISTVVFLSTGFLVAIQELALDEPGVFRFVVPVEVLFGLFSYALWCLSFMVLFLAVFEYREYRIEKVSVVVE